MRSFVGIAAPALMLGLSVMHKQMVGVRAFVAKPTGFHVTTQLGMFNFLNEGKKALVKSLAGEYDEAVIKSRLDNLIADNSVLMLSFTT